MPYEAELTPIGPDIWIGFSPARILGMPLTTTMTVVRLADSKLLVHSPTRITPDRLRAVRQLGSVRHLYAPSITHHRRVGDWVAEFPEALVHAPAQLRPRRPDLVIGRTIGGDLPKVFRGHLIEIPIEGFRLHETVLYHLTSRTLIVTDLVSNIGTPRDAWTRLYAGVMGFYGRVGLSRAIRWLGFSDRNAARRSVEKILDRAIDQVVVGHGAPIQLDAKDSLREGLRWLF